MEYSIAVIGAGNIAVSHLKALQTMDQLNAVAVADISNERVSSIAEQFGIRSYSDYKDMIMTEKPDIAVITLPHYLHMEAAVFCADHQCHIMLEKPMAMNELECAKIIEAAKRNRIQLMVGHTQQFLPLNLQVKELLSTIDLGPLIMINDVRHGFYFVENRPAWFLDRSKSGGGIVMNLGAHEVDKIIWLTRQRIRKVSAKLSHYAPRGNVEGSGLIYMETELGVPVTISLSGYHKTNCSEMLMVYRDGEIHVNIGTQEITLMKEGIKNQVPLETWGQTFVLQFQQLTDAIESGTAPECSGDYGKKVIEIIDAVYHSHETGKEIYLKS